MLSRAAEALFWIGRYAERAEDTARLLDVHFHQIIVDPAVDEAATCTVVATVMGLRDTEPDPLPATVRGGARPARVRPGQPVARSPARCAAARENARGVRESLSSEIWECLNTTYLRAAAADVGGPAVRPGAVLLVRAAPRGHATPGTSRRRSAGTPATTSSPSAGRWSGPT